MVGGKRDRRVSERIAAQEIQIERGPPTPRQAEAMAEGLEMLAEWLFRRFTLAHRAASGAKPRD